MLENSYDMKNLSARELQHNLYAEEVRGVPIWRILRFKTRTKFLKKTTDFNNLSNKKAINKILLVKFYFLSFYKILRLLLRKKTYKNVVFAFPRLAKLEGVYLDKFTDPLIEYSSMKEKVLVFQKSLGGTHFKPRIHQKYVVESDFMDLTAKALGIILLPFFAIAYGKKVKKLYNVAKPIFQLPKRFIFFSLIAIGEYYISYFFYKLILKKLKVENTFVVNRTVFISQILASRKVKAKTYELQHGVTMADTILYTGEYHPIADPDYFLTFGKKWIGPQFYIPLKKMINIGWAYKKQTLQLAENYKENTQDVLVVSSPSCTFKLFELIQQLAKKHLEITFYLRLHPQEAYQQKQLGIIQATPNLQLETSQIDSAVIVHTYQHIMGENSSVLFEALCAGKKVARLNVGGLNIKDEGGVKQKGFYYLQNMSDFEDYLEDESLIEINDLGIYDDFKKETFNQLIA